MSGGGGTTTHRVVIVGCGFGGLFAARALGGKGLDVTVIDRTNHHVFQPLLYQVATGILSEGDIAPPIREVLRKRSNVRTLMGEVTGFDLAARQVEVRLANGDTAIGYDSLIVATGAVTSYFGHDTFAASAPGMKTVADALDMRARIFGAFERAEVETDPDRQREQLTFVVVGAGPTGVEMAGQIAELSHRSLRRNFRSIDPASARVVLLDGATEVLTAYGPRLADRTVRDLGKLGVRVRLGAMVTDVTPEGITFTENGTEQHVAARTIFWAAGVHAAPPAELLARAAGVTTDRGGRVPINPDCTLPGHPEVFAIGDMATLDKLPGVAEVAMQQGVYAALTIRRRLRGRPDRKPFRYRDLGQMATISRFRAIVAIGPLRLSGFVGWVLWLFVHLMFLTGFKNRIATVSNWFIAFLGRGRPQRVIVTAPRRPRDPAAEVGAPEPPEARPPS
jgi:NADH dehydrogenase